MTFDDELAVRAATALDAPTICAIYNQGITDRVATLETEPRTPADRRDWLAARDARHPVLVAETGGRVVGWASLNVFNPRAAYDSVADVSVYVARPARGRGVGRRLLEALIGLAPGLGYHKLVLAALPANAGGRALYAHLGFQEVGVYREQGRLDGRWVDVLVMERLLEGLRRVESRPPIVAKGLENLIVAETVLSDIDGQAGRLYYRGYDAVELAHHCRYEDVWHLLVSGELPVDGRFAGRAAAGRTSPLDPTTIAGIARGPGLMSAVQAAIAAAGAAWGVRPWHERDPREAEAEAVRLVAVVPTLVAALWRAGRGLAPLDPDPALGHVANFLRMLDGRAPSADRVLALERYVVLTAEHGMNASTFTARVVASTGADVVSAIAGAAGALSGPLHGGAPSLVLDMLDEIATPARAGAWIGDAIAGGRRLMGFGHRVYRAEDPRAACLRDTAEALGGERVALARAVEQEALARLRAAKPNRALYTNVEFWSAVVLERAGLPRALFTPTFCAARTAGWAAHVLEQVRDNRLIRPSSEYVGPRGRVLDPARATA